MATSMIQSKMVDQKVKYIVPLRTIISNEKGHIMNQSKSKSFILPILRLAIINDACNVINI